MCASCHPPPMAVVEGRIGCASVGMHDRPPRLRDGHNVTTKLANYSELPYSLRYKPDNAAPFISTCGIEPRRMVACTVYILIFTVRLVSKCVRESHLCREHSASAPATSRNLSTLPVALTVLAALTISLGRRAAS